MSLDRMFINGEWVGAADGRTLEVVDPATEQVVGSVPVAGPAEIEAALRAAEAGFAAWRQVDAWSRSRVLRRIADFLRQRADEVAATLTEEMGKPLGEARGEVLASADQFEWYAEETKRIYGRVIDGHSRDLRLLVLRQPIGPVAAFSPWNFPALLASRKLAPAFAAGCSVLLKPAREAPRTALWLARACQESGLPPGVLSVLTGDAATISEALIRSPVVRKVTLTGSTEVGKRLMALCAEQVKPLTLELGGHAPVLVFDDADVERAAELCARGKFRNCGQVCIAASRFFVQKSVAERFTARFVEVARSLAIGDGRRPGVEVGPLASRRRVEATERLVADALARGARLACGGQRPPEQTRGFFFQPTVLTDVDGSMALMVEEPFAPIAPITTFADLEDGLRQANASEYGLAGYVFSESTRTAFLAAEGLDVGMVGVNHLLLATAEIPFGGVKRSGFGREGGTEWIDAYTVAKHVSIRL